MTDHECVKEWLEIRPFGTRKQYGCKLIYFCEETGMSPEEFLSLDPFEARDVVWKFVKPFIKESTSKAKNNMAALKSFYRSKMGRSSLLIVANAENITSTVKNGRKLQENMFLIERKGTGLLTWQLTLEIKLCF